MLRDRLRLKTVWSHSWKFCFLTVCSFLFFQVFPTFCFPCFMFAISTGIFLHAALHLLPVFLFVHALIMRYGTVVYAVSERDIGYHPRLE